MKKRGLKKNENKYKENEWYEKREGDQTEA